MLSRKLRPSAADDYGFLLAVRRRLANSIIQLTSEVELETGHVEAAIDEKQKALEVGYRAHFTGLSEE